MSNKPTHYQIQTSLKELESLATTPEQKAMLEQFMQNPKAQKYMEDPSMLMGGLNNLANRVGTLAGNFAEFITDNGSGATTRYGLSPSQNQYINENRQEVSNFVDEFKAQTDKTFAPDSFHAEKYENEDFSIGNLYGLAAEQGLSSIADIAAMSNPVTMAAYGASEANRLANERATNDGREGNLQASDYAIGGATALGNVALERLGAKYILPDDVGNPFIKEVAEKFGEGADAINLTNFTDTGANVLLETGKSFLKGGAVEGATEYVQESGEYLGTTLGTEEGFDAEEMHKRGVMGATVGGMVGSHLRGAGTVGQRINKENNLSNLQAGYESQLDGLREQRLYSNIDDRSMESGLVSDEYAQSFDQPVGIETNWQGINAESYDMLSAMAYESDPQMAEAIDSMDMDTGHKAAWLNSIANKDENYHNLVNQYRQSEMDNAFTQTQQAHDQRLNEYEQFGNNTQAYLDAEQRRFKQANQEQLNDQRVGLRPNVLFTLARDQQEKQETQAQEQQAISDNVMGNIEANKANSNFAGMAEREQQVKSESTTRQWSKVAKSVKAKRKRLKKQLRQAQADSRLSLQMDRMYNRLEQQEKNRQEEIAMQDWEKTNLARQFRQAQEIGIDKEFNKLALAVRDAISQLPAEVQDTEAAKAEQAITNWVQEEVSNVEQTSVDDGSGSNGELDSGSATGESDLEVGGVRTELPDQEQQRSGMGDVAIRNGQRSGTDLPMGTGRNADGNTVNSEIDKKANEAATSPLNDLPEPTQAQKEAGNYKKGKIAIQGINISIENPKGSTRSGVDQNGNKWESKMNHHYGDIKGTNGADGDSIDVFVGDSVDSGKVFVIDQVDSEKGEFDEHKVMLGFESIEEAKEAYLSNYDEGWQGLGDITETDIDSFKEWSKRPRKSKQPFATKAASQEAVSVSEPKKAPNMEEDHIYSSTTPDGKTIVKGDTYKKKDAIKAKGAKWDKDRKGWVFDKAEDAAEFINSDGDTYGKSQAVKQTKYAIASGKQDGDVWVNERKNTITEVEVRDDKVIIGKTKRIGKKTEETSQEYSLSDIKKYLSDDEVSKLEVLKVAKGAELEVDNEISKAETASQPEPDNTTLYQAFVKAIEDSNIPKNSLEMRKFVAQLEGKNFNEVTKADEQKAQEIFEAAMTQYARKLAKGNRNRPQYVVDMLTAKYMAQPNLNVMSATTGANMAYSTPAPISYLTNLAAGITEKTKVLEPTAGNGLLLITNGTANTTVNELDPNRMDKLEYLGYENVTSIDATSDTELAAPRSQDSVIMNPPFGKADKPYMAKSADGLDYKLEDLDHIIAAKQLEAMKDEGTAILIMGANRDAGIVRGGKTGRFMNWLYFNYNVVDHVEIDGKVYKKQGAEWPIRVITIHGRKNTGQYAPANGSIERLTGNDAKEIINKLYNRYAENGLLGTADPALSGNARANDNDLRNGSGQTTNSRVNQPSDLQQDIQSTESTQPTRAKRNAGSGRNDATRSNNGQVVSDRGNSNTDLVGDTTSGSRTGKQTLVGASQANSATTNNQVSGGRNPKSIIRDLESETDSGSNQLQSKYKPASAGFNQGVLTPVNMAGKTRKALANLVREVGDLDPFLANELGYESIEKLHEGLAALQVDAASLSINKIKQGKAIIIADQTGVGKGRQAAAIIRYALKTGKTPVFITQKANLFSDMYGDLKDIKTDNVRPFIFNNGESITAGSQSLFKTTKGVRKSGFDTLKKGKMPKLEDDKPANALFLTYDQISTENEQRQALDAIADNAILILDESHTAAGADAKRGIYLRNLLSKTKGAMYLSATFAKRPDNLGLYHLTSLGDAVENMEELQEALSSGGLQLQTLVSAMLSEEGELIRREKSFEGIKIDNVVDTKNTASHTEKFNKSTDILRDIVKLGKGFVAHIKKVNKDNKQASEFKADTNVDKLNPFMFSSVVHNYVSQLTMAIKAESAAQKALEAIADGKRPVIALESTLETKLKEYMKSNGLANGDSVAGFTFGDMFEKGLLNAISLSRKLPNGETEKEPYSFSDLPPHLYKQYQNILSKIEAVDLSDIPVSPIDFIRKQITDAGYSVEEVTGRKTMVDYSDNLKIMDKPASESKANRRKVIDRFNKGATDVLILNQSGSTGLSIHASEKFEDQRPRHMIVAQPSLDINTFMQMLGRINRTGQVVLPSYDVLWLDLPSENRPATVVANKMKGLNANTSANTDSATSIESMDIFNKYGDEIVLSYLQENPEFLTEMSVKESDVISNAENLAQFITGKLALLPVNRQSEFYDDVEAAYKDHINHLKATGEYALETQTMDLDAKPVSQTVLAKGEGKSVFDSDIKLTYADVKSQGKPPSPEDFEALFRDADSKAVSQLYSDAKQQFDNYLSDKYDSKIDNLSKELSKTTKEEDVASIREEMNELTEKRRLEREVVYDISNLLNSRMREGSVIKLDFSNGDSVYGVVKAVKYAHKGKGNPMSKSKFKVQILTASGMGNLTVPLSQLMGEKGVMSSLNHISNSQLLSIANSEYNRPQREKRYIVTGNLIKAFSMLDDGRVINFSKQNGGNEIGILLPKKFKPENISKKNYARDYGSIEKYLNYTKDVSNDHTLMSLGVSNVDGLKFSINRSGDIRVDIPVSNKDLRGKYLTPEMTQILGEEPVYRKGDKSVDFVISKSQGEKLFKYASELQPFPMKGGQLDTFNQANDIDDEFQKVSGSDIKFSTESVMADKKKPKGISVDAVNKVVATMTNEFSGNMPRIIVRDTQQELYGQEATTEKYGFIKGGYSNTGQPAIGLVASNLHSSSDARRTIRHELVGHYGFSILPQDYKKKIIQRITNSGNKGVKAEFDRLSKDRVYSKQANDVIAEETFAHIIESGETKFQAIINELLNLIRQGLKSVGLLNKDAISKSELHAIARQIAKAIRSGSTPTDPSGSKSNASKDGYKVSMAGTMFRTGGTNLSGKRKPKKWYQNIANSAVDSVKGFNELGFMMVNQIVEQHEGKFKEGNRSYLREYYYHLNDSDAYRSNLANKAEKEIEEVWDEAQSNDPESTDRMSSLMIDSTMSRIDPSSPLENQTVYEEQLARRDDLQGKIEEIETTIMRTGRQSEKQSEVLDSMGNQLADVIGRIKDIESMYDELQQEFNNLPQANKDLFIKTKEFYLFTWKQTLKAIKERISQLELDDELAAAASSKIDLVFRKAIEQGVYFPLARFGEHVVIARHDDGSIATRLHFESESEAKEVAEEMRQDGFAVEIDTLVNTAQYDQSNVVGFSKKIIGDIKKMSDDLQVDSALDLDDMQDLLTKIPDIAVMDMIYQAMLRTLPTQSAAKSLIHRKYVQGASHDSRRAFSNAIFHQSFKIAKIKYEHLMTRSIDKMREMLDNPAYPQGQRKKARKVYEKIANIHTSNMNPDTPSWVSRLTNYAFMFHLGGSISAGAINTTQTWLIGLPELGSRYGYDEALAELSKATAQYGKLTAKKSKNFDVKNAAKGEAWVSLKDSEYLTAQESKVIGQLHKEGDIENTQTQMLAQIAETDMQNGAKFSRFRIKLSRALGSFFHNAEIYNREVTALAAIRLQKKKNPETSDRALKEVGRRAIKRIHFDYGSSNRALYMRGNAKALLVFKQYSQNIIYLMTDNLNKVFRGASKAERAQGAKAISGIFIGHLIAGGYVALPLASTILAALSWAIEDEDEDRNLDAEFRTYLNDINPVLSDLVSKGVVNALTPLDLSTRIKLDGLLYRSPTQELSPTDYGLHIASEILGAGVGTIVQQTNGLATIGQGVAEGDYLKAERGVERLLPKFVRDPIKASRRVAVGELNYSGDPVMDAEHFGLPEFIGQSIGFGDSDLSDVYEKRNAVNNYHKRLSNRRKLLMTRFYNDLLNDRPLDKVVEDIVKFSVKNPEYAISGEDLTRSVNAREKRNLQTNEGVYTPKTKPSLAELYKF